SSSSSSFNHWSRGKARNKGTTLVVDMGILLGGAPVKACQETVTLPWMTASVATGRHRSSDVVQTWYRLHHIQGPDKGHPCGTLRTCKSGAPKCRRCRGNRPFRGRGRACVCPWISWRVSMPTPRATGEGERTPSCICSVGRSSRPVVSRISSPELLRHLRHREPPPSRAPQDCESRAGSHPERSRSVQPLGDYLRDREARRPAGT